MGVSPKTVEAWELGRTHPTGPAFRLLSIIEQGKETELSFVSVDETEIFSARNKHPLLEGGQLALTIPETPNHPN